MELKAKSMTQQIRKAIERITERLQEYVEALESLPQRDRLVREPVPVRSNPQYRVSKKSLIR